MSKGQGTGRNAAFYTCFVMLGLYISSYQSMVDQIAAEFGMDLTRMGAIVAVHFVGSALAPPLMGKLSDRKGTRAAVLLALLLIVVGLLALGLSASGAAAATGILLVGCGYAAAEGLLTGALALLNPARVERVINRSQMWFCVGAVAGPLFAAQGMRLAGWRAIELMLALAFSLAALVLLHFPMPQAAPVARAQPLRLWRAPLLLALCLAMALYVGVEQGLAFFMGSHYADAGAQHLAQWALAAYWAGMIAGRMAGSLRKARHRLHTMLGLALAILALPFALMLGGAPSAALFGLVGLCLAAAWPMLTALAAARYASASGTAMGCLMTAGALGGTAFPPLIGRLGERFGLSGSLLLMPALLAAVIALLAAAPALAAHRQGGRADGPVNIWRGR